MHSSDQLQLVSLDDYCVRPQVTWLVRDLLPAEAIVVLYGAPKSGKTHVVTDMTMHAAHGMHWCGHTVTRALRIAYLAGEGHIGLRVRLHAWRRHHGAELRGDMRLLPEALSLVPRVSEVLEVLRPYRPDVIVIDTANRYYGSGDENSSADMTAWVHAVQHVRDELHCAVIIVHHTGHGDQSRERGSSVLRAAADVVAQVARDESGSGMIGLQIVAARDMEPWSEPLSLRLVPAETDWADEEGQPITTCIVAAGDAPVTLPGRGGRPLGIAQATVLAVARELAATRRNGSDDVTIARHGDIRRRPAARHIPPEHLVGMAAAPPARTAAAGRARLHRHPVLAMMLGSEGLTVRDVRLYRVVGHSDITCPSVRFVHSDKFGHSDIGALNDPAHRRNSRLQLADHARLRRRMTCSPTEHALPTGPPNPNAGWSATCPVDKSLDNLGPWRGSPHASAKGALKGCSAEGVSGVCLFRP